MEIVPLAAILGGFLVGVCVERIVKLLRTPGK